MFSKFQRNINPYNMNFLSFDTDYRFRIFAVWERPKMWDKKVIRKWPKSDHKNDHQNDRATQIWSANFFSKMIAKMITH